MAEQAAPSRFVWYELMTTEPQAAPAFYQAVVGWTTQAWQGGMDYTMWVRGETPLGGLMPLPKEAAEAGAPPYWLPYVGVGDLAVAVAKARELGAGVLVPPTDIPGAGGFAVLQDPQGATFALHVSSSGSTVPTGPPQVGEVSWHELATTDPAAAFVFYDELFGWQKADEHDMGPMGMYRMFGYGEYPVGAMFGKPPEMPGPPSWLLYVRVPDLNRAVESVKEHGGSVLNGPMEVPGGDWIAQCLDPQGAAFALHQVAEKG